MLKPLSGLAKSMISERIYDALLTNYDHKAVTEYLDRYLTDDSIGQELYSQVVSDYLDRVQRVGF